ncbi:MAG: terminase family protein [Sphingomonas bacterium]|nr:terminase family protein [Sphingomonas bacterium]
MPTNRPILPRATNLVDHLLTLPPEWRHVAVQSLGPDARASLDRDWPSWAHDGQCPPPADQWRSWVILAGRGFGKTLAGAQWITAAVEAARGANDRLLIALVGATLDDARRVMIEGNSGLLAVAAPHIAGWWPSRRLLKFTGGSEAVLFSGASPEALRGPEHHLAWCDELAKWEQPEHCWDMLQLGLRLGDRPRSLITTTPRPGPVLSRIMAQPDTIVTGGSTHANPHLPPAFIAAIDQLYANTRLGAQEIEGKLLTDSPGALWSVELLERARMTPLPLAGGAGGGPVSKTAHSDPTPACPERSRGITRIVIGVDPPSGDGTCGIIACALDDHGIGHVLADHSVTACSPERWAKAVADVAAMHANPLILAERNQGGNMVKAVLHVADPQLRIKLVTAVQGKTARAEPVAMLFEADKVCLHGHLPELEAELLRMIAGGDVEGPSPDRADAMVWALTELMLKPDRIPRVHQF